MNALQDYVKQKNAILQEKLATEDDDSPNNIAMMWNVIKDMKKQQEFLLDQNKKLEKENKNLKKNLTMMQQKNTATEIFEEYKKNNDVDFEPQFSQNVAGASNSPVLSGSSMQRSARKHAFKPRRLEFGDEDSDKGI